RRLSRKVGAVTRKTKSAPELGNELLEMLDRAASTHPRVDGIAPGTEPVVFRLKIEAAVEIKSRTVLVQLGANVRAIDEDEVDLLGSLKKRALDRRDWNALRALLLDPFDLRHQRSRLDRNAKDHLVLDDEPCNRLADRSWLRSEKA